jgi:hypothetical protein
LRESRLTTEYWLIVSLELLILDLAFVQEFAKTKNEIITGFIYLFLQPVALASKQSVVYQEIKIYKKILKCVILSTVSSDCFFPSFMRVVVARIECSFSSYVFCVSSMHIDFSLPKLHRNLEIFFSEEILFYPYPANVENRVSS